jgi:hypothetical protein
MRAGRLRAALAVLLAGSGFGLGVGSALASEAEEAPEASQTEASAAREAPPEAPPTRRPRQRGQRASRAPEQWWVHAREVLFDDVELSEDQARQVDAIIEGRVAVRRRVRELQADLRVARQQGDAKRSAELQEELRANRAQLKNPHARIEEIRELLTEEQRPTFDMNRARLVAEGQQARKARQGQRPKRAGPGAGTKAKTE